MMLLILQQTASFALLLLDNYLTNVVTDNILFRKKNPPQ